MRVRDALLSYGRNGLFKIRHESDLLDLSTDSNGELLAGLAIAGSIISQ